MPFKNEKVPCNFVGNLKVGDNLVFNCQILSNLVSANNNGCFNKLIVLQVGSILEACLCEIIFRAQNFNREGVPNISESDRREIEGKKIDKFNSVIDVLKKYKVLKLDPNIYDELHKLRKYRNKVHIQDNIEIKGISRDEAEAFSSETCNWVIELNRRVIKHLSEYFSRPEDIRRYMEPLSIPVLEPQDYNGKV
jgi:hypothetical protein